MSNKNPSATAAAERTWTDFARVLGPEATAGKDDRPRERVACVVTKSSDHFPRFSVLPGFLKSEDGSFQPARFLPGNRLEEFIAAIAEARTLIDAERKKHAPAPRGPRGPRPGSEIDADRRRRR